MATDESDGTVDLVDLRTLEWYATLPATRGLIANGLAFTPSGELVTGDEGGNITFWDTRTRAVIRKLHVADPVNFLAVSPDGTRLALQMQAADSSNTVVAVIDLATGATVHSYSVPDGSGGVAFSPDGRELAALGCCSPGSTVELWDAASGQRLPGPHITGQLQSIAFSPASAVLGIGTADGKVYLWDAAAGRQTRRAGHGGGVQRAPDRLLARRQAPRGRASGTGARSSSTCRPASSWATRSPSRAECSPPRCSPPKETCSSTTSAPPPTGRSTSGRGSATPARSPDGTSPPRSGPMSCPTGPTSTSARPDSAGNHLVGSTHPRHLISQTLNLLPKAASVAGRCRISLVGCASQTRSVSIRCEIRAPRRL